MHTYHRQGARQRKHTIADDLCNHEQRHELGTMISEHIRHSDFPWNLLARIGSCNESDNDCRNITRSRRWWWTNLMTVLVPEDIVLRLYVVNSLTVVQIIRLLGHLLFVECQWQA
jgi:hypothetical protein